MWLIGKSHHKDLLGFLLHFNTCFNVGVIFFTVVMYVASLTGIILMYIFFADVSDYPIIISSVYNMYNV